MKTKIPTMADYHKVLKEQGLGSIQKPFLKEEDIYGIVLTFNKFREEIKKRDTLVFTSEESKWYTRLERIINTIEGFEEKEPSEESLEY